MLAASAYRRAPLVNPAYVPLSDAALHPEGAMKNRIQQVLNMVDPRHMSTMDSVLATKLGVHAAKLIAQERFGRTVAVVGGKVTSNKLADIAGLTKFVDPKGEMVMTAKHIGVSFGDE